MKKYGICPFWFWNGDMEDDKIVSQIAEMNDKGIIGFFIHPRQGLKVPYLSKEWFRKVRLAVDTAARFNMEAWIYDEFPYPSGNCAGGILLEHPEWSAKVIRPIYAKIKGNEEKDFNLGWGKILSAAAYPEKDGKPDWTQPIDLTENIGIRYDADIYQESGLTKYNKKRYFSGNPSKHLHFKADDGEYTIAVFIAKDIDNYKYFKKLADPLNPAVIDYFMELTHEKYRKYLGDEFGKTIKGFYSDEISPFFMEYPWSPVLRDEFKKRCGYDLYENLPALFLENGRVRYDYKNVLTEIFFEGFEKKIKSWCNENNLLYVGEKPIERFAQLEFFDYPGIDCGHEKMGDAPCIAPKNYRSSGKMASSAARFYHKERVLCECFHSVGWSMNINDMKYIIDYLAFLGITMFVPHAFFYTTDALTKHDAPPSVFFQMPWWKHMRVLSDYTNNLCDKLTRAKREVDVLLFDPVCANYSASAGEADKLKQAFADIQQELFRRHLDFYIVDDKLIEKAEVKDGKIVLDGECFTALVMPEMFSDFGVPTAQVDALKANGAWVIEEGKLPDELKSPIKLSSDNIPLDEVFVSRYETEKGKMFFVLNSSDKSGELQICDDGKTVVANLLQFSSKLISESDRVSCLPVHTINLDEKFAVKAMNCNALRIHSWELEMLDKNGKLIYKNHINEGIPYISLVAKQEISTTVKSLNLFGCVQRIKLPEATCRYSSKFLYYSDAACRLHIEKGSIYGEHSILINGKRVVDDDITSLLVQGENEICIIVDIKRDTDGLINPIYICGDFGIYRRNDLWSIEKLQSEGLFFEDAKGGLPFYAGDVVYEKEFFVDDTESNMKIAICDTRVKSALTLVVNDEEVGTCAWAPYEWNVDARLIKKGQNKLKLIKSTELLGYFEGMQVVPETGEICDIN